MRPYWVIMKDMPSLIAQLCGVSESHLLSIWHMR